MSEEKKLPELEKDPLKGYIETDAEYVARVMKILAQEEEKLVT